MAHITTQAITTSGTAPTLAPAAAADTADTGTRTFLVCKNTNGSSRTVTIAGQGNLATGAAYPDRVYTLAATTGEQWIPLLPVYRNENGVAELTWSATADVTRAVVRI